MGFVGNFLLLGFSVGFFPSRKRVYSWTVLYCHCGDNTLGIRVRFGFIATKRVCKNWNRFILDITTWN